MRNRKIILGLLCLITMTGILLLGGCGTPEPPADEANPTLSATLFFINDEYVSSGDESLPKTVGVQREITVAKTDNYYMALMDALREVPEGGLSTMITEDIRFRDIYISPDDREMLLVDLYPEGLSGGSLGEALFIRQVVDTLLGSGALIKFEDEDLTLTKVQFLVNGEITESLMGHFDATKPFTSSQSGE